jgi:hypothetical protein
MKIPKPHGGHKKLFIVLGITFGAVAIAYVIYRRKAAADALAAEIAATPPDTSANGALGTVTPVSNVAGYPSYSGNYTGALSPSSYGTTPGAPAVRTPEDVVTNGDAFYDKQITDLSGAAHYAVVVAPTSTGYDPGASVFNINTMVNPWSSVSDPASNNYSQAPPDLTSYNVGNYPYFDGSNPATFGLPARPPGSAPSPTGN